MADSCPFSLENSPRMLIVQKKALDEAKLAILDRLIK